MALAAALDEVALVLVGATYVLLESEVGYGSASEVMEVAEVDELLAVVTGATDAELEALVAKVLVAAERDGATVDEAAALEDDALL